MNYRNPVHGLDSAGNPEPGDPDVAAAYVEPGTPDTQALRDLAQDLVDQYGWSGLDDRLRIVEWMDTRGLITGDARTDDDNADAVESRMRWLLEE